jgi:ribosomal protein S18 acetylase RimI-like enzyme
MAAARPVFSEMTIADYSEVLALWQVTENVGLSDADSREGTEVFLARNAGLSLVARHEGRLVGAVLCGHDGRRGYLHHLSVAPDFRLQGLARDLIDRCLVGLARVGIQKCHAWVYAENLAGLEFWKRTGWTPRMELQVVSRDIAAAS